MTNGKKEGLATKEEVKILWKVASGNLPVPKVIKPVLAMLLPGFIDGLDNKYGDNIPEPWQTHLENMTTMVVAAVEDKVITKEEADEIAAYMAVVIDEKIDVPLIGDDVEAVVFLETSKLIAALIYGAVAKKK